MLKSDEVILAKEIVHWHIFSDKTSDPKPGPMTIEEAESILAEFNRSSESQDFVSLSVFYFSEDETRTRMGSSYAYMVGIAESGDVYWSAPGELVPAQAQPNQFQGIQPLTQAFVRRPDLDGSYPILRILNGKSQDSFSLGDMVNAGMGNWGFALGFRQCPVTE